VFCQTVFSFRKKRAVWQGGLYFRIKYFSMESKDRFFKVRDYICKRSLVLKCVVSASNEFVDIDLQIRLSGKFPETLCAKYAVANKTVARGFRGFPEQANFTPTGV